MKAIPWNDQTIHVGLGVGGIPAVSHKEKVVRPVQLVLADEQVTIRQVNGKGWQSVNQTTRFHKVKPEVKWSQRANANGLRTRQLRSADVVSRGRLLWLAD